MTAFAGASGIPPEAAALRDGFLRWQCRVRQMAMRDAQGKPDASIMPAVTLDGETEPFGHVITVLNKSITYSTVPEFRHMAKSTFDPAQRRDKALQFLSSSYYQRAHEFNDTLTASFMPGSKGAASLLEARECTLHFAAFNQQFDLTCTVQGLGTKHPLYQATYWHNLLFNPGLPGDTIILGFTPDWPACSANPPVQIRKIEEV